MNFYFWDNQGRLFPHMRNAICNALKSPGTENHEGVMGEVLQTSQSQQYLFAKDILFHDAYAFNQYMHELLKRLDGKHGFDDQECAFFLVQLFHLRSYKGDQPIEPINEAIVSLLDGYTGDRNIFTARGFSDFDCTADSYKLESVDSAICRYFKRLKNFDRDKLLATKIEDLFVGYHLPSTLKFWISELHEREQSGCAYKDRTQNFIDHLCGQDAIDSVYMKQLEEGIGLKNLLSYFDAIRDNRSIAHELVALCKTHGEDKVITDDRLNSWQKKVNFGQSTRTLSALASTSIDWSEFPRLLKFAITNLRLYHQDFIGFFPDNSLLEGAIHHNLEDEYVRSLLLTTADPLLPESKVINMEPSALLEGIIVNAEAGIAPSFKEHHRGYLTLIGKAFSAKGAENMPDYVDQISTAGKQFFFGFLTHEHTDKQALFDRFPDVKRATLSSEMGL